MTAHILPNGEMTEPLEIDQFSSAHWRLDRIVFRSSSPGDRDIAAACHARGTYEGWLRALGVVANYPKVLLGLYASFVPPLLEILRVSNFVLNWGNRTTTGKTTTLRGAASTWGNPNEHDPDSMVGTWDATPVGVERTCATRTGLPVILDDTKRAKKPENIAPIIYLVSQGQGRTRGSTKGLARVPTWRTVLLSTGEQPATSFTQDGGTRTRCMEVRGVPFGRQDKELEPVIADLNLAVCQNYGHAGPIFVQHLLRQRDRWDGLRANYQKAKEYFVKRAPTPEGARLAPYAAAIQMAAHVAHQALELPWKFEDPLQVLWEEIAGGAADAAGEGRALQDVMSWASAREATFKGREHRGAYGEREPPGGWSGRWSADEGWEYVGFFPHVLRRILGELGYQPPAILEGWRERGWIDHAKGRFEKQVRVDHKQEWLIIIKRTAIEEANA